jgi:hypothetical protein
MQRISCVFACCFAAAAVAQVLSPPEILDPELRELQQKHMAELKAVAVAISSHQFPYHFYFSRKLDVSEQQEKLTDQRSIQFARFQNQIVLQITGNYFASYSAELLNKEDRARRTLEDVMIPILKTAAAGIGQEPSIQRFALEVSHHVRKKTLGVITEHAENIVVTMPREAAASLAAARDEGETNLAMGEASIFVDGQQTAWWTQPAEPQAARAAVPPPPTAARPAPPSPARATSPDALRALQEHYQETLNRLTRDLDATARFVGYAPPSFIAFHNGIYLQLSLTTPVGPAAVPSRYVAAATAFDEHIARLVRRVIAYFENDPGFDGIDFSTTVRAASGEDSGGAFAIEYILNFPALRSYAHYDSTGQQLLNSGFILVNGERVGLDLQIAESGGTR